MKRKYERPYARNLGDELSSAQGTCSLGSVAGGSPFCLAGSGVLHTCNKGSVADDSGCSGGSAPAAGACNAGLIPSEVGCAPGISAAFGCHDGDTPT
jgi:hypothetical protein